MCKTYLPAFKACAQEGKKVEGVMGTHNRTNGDSCCGSRLAQAGNYTVFAGMSQPDKVSERLTSIKAYALEVLNKSEIIFDE